jgi:hypothetical protein
MGIDSCEGFFASKVPFTSGTIAFTIIGVLELPEHPRNQIATKQPRAKTAMYFKRVLQNGVFKFKFIL